VNLQQKVRYTLGKNERLKSRKAIEQLFKDSRSFAVFPVKIIFKRSPFTGEPATKLQAAFSVSKRNFKKAVDRNRIKRLMREAWRLQKNSLQDTLQQTHQQAVIFILYVGNDIPAYEVVKEKIGTALKKLQKIIHEAPAANS